MLGFATVLASLLPFTAPPPATAPETVASAAPEVRTAATPQLTVRQAIGQRIVAGYSGTRVPPVLEGLIRRGELGGVIVFADNITSRSALAAEMRRIQRLPRPAGLRAPLLTMIDQEGGLVKRLPGAPSLSPAQIGARGSTATARAQGRATARNLRAAGINTNLAPVVDVGRPGSHTRRLGRSYSGDPAVVARLGTAFARAHADGGALATLKHWPGLGLARTDEDDRANVLRIQPHRLREIDERPFVAGARAKVPLIMVSTGIYPSLDSRPALFSRRISTTELRRTGFRGLTITDDLDVTALRRYASPAGSAVLATRAGIDILLFAQSPSSVTSGITALQRAAASGRVTRATLERSARKVLALRRGL